MKKSIIVWAASAVLYLGVVVAGYSVYASINPQEVEHTEHAAAMVQEKEGSDNQSSHDSHDSHGATAPGEVA